MGLARVAAAPPLVVAVAFATALTIFAPHAALRDARADDVPRRLVVIADRDDDDRNGVPDGAQAELPVAARADLLPLDKSWFGTIVKPTSGAALARLIVDGHPYAWDRPIYGMTVALQGVAPGTVTAVVSRGGKKEPLEIVVRGVSMRDGAGKPVDMTRSHASFERIAPERTEGPAGATYDDPDALRVVLELPGSPAVSPDVGFESVSSHGVRVDVLAHVAVTPAPCDTPTPLSSCFATAPIRLVIDDIDRKHPLVEARSLRAEVAGAVVVRLDGKKAQQIRVLGPRSSPIGPIGAFRATLRPFILRVTPGGAPAIGTTDAGAIVALRTELGAASAIWGQCGVTLGETRTADVKIVDPPPPYLIAIGDGLGLPASGGDIAFKVDGHAFTVAVAAASPTDRVAYDVAKALERAGYAPVVSPNARIGPGASGSVDVLVRRRDGSFASCEAMGPSVPLTTDATLTVRIGSVDLADGLQHFTDTDAMAGTLEERALLKALDDGDPRTIEVVVVPLFAGGGRIGESFIGSDLSSLRNVVLLDRAGIRARKSSLTLAHELGHVLMDMPGHPDDFGVDTPTILMDSDASDASPYGPRRISVDECVRVIRQAGPTGRVPLLTPIVLAPIPADTRPLIGN